MINWIRNILAQRRSGRPAENVNRPAFRFGGSPLRPLHARYDAAQTTDENRRHWAAADQLSANAAANPQVRRILRSRARYEVANNSYARGIVLTLANYVVGTGPRLQMLTGEPAVDRLVEREFGRWAKAVGLAHKLRTMRIGEAESGEVFAVMATNPQVDAPVQLDLKLVEADQVTTPFGLHSDEQVTDGIIYDEFGNPTSYFVLKHHPGDRDAWRAGRMAYDQLPAESVLHLYRVDRPGQGRGIPEITPALPLFAMLRDYGLAVLQAAQQAALPGGVIYTDAPADTEAAKVEPMDSVEMDRGMWLTMPYGWKVGQVRAEQPTTMHDQFTRTILQEIARCLNMPFNIAAGNSAGYNFASGRLDHQSFYKAIRIDQAFIGDTVLDRVLRAWLDEAVLVEGYLPQALRQIDTQLPHQWFWDGLEHVDPAKEANATATKLASHTTNLAIEYARQGLDWEAELRQKAKEKQLMQRLGLDDTEGEAAVGGQQGDDEETVQETVGGAEEIRAND
ncbi:MAG: phage portal protein [Phycisphaeraceae bacterium]